MFIVLLETRMISSFCELWFDDAISLIRQFDSLPNDAIGILVVCDAVAG